MTAAVAFFNGRIGPEREIAIPLWDTGFVQGVTVSEQLRTFRGQLFRLRHHLERLERSLGIVGITMPYSLSEIEGHAESIASRNHKLLPSGSDLGLAILVTPGPYSAFAPVDAPHEPTVCIHTYPLAFRLWADKFESGQSLVTTSIRHVPEDCWPSALKCRSRMNYYLADAEARKIEKGSRALMQDHDGFVTEATTANIVLALSSGELVAPPIEKTLPGISVAVLRELASAHDVPFTTRDLTVDNVATAAEVFLTSTSPCMLPVVRLNGKPIGDGKPGPQYRRLLSAWSDLLGLDIAKQARDFA